jgi:hypothetical protein
LQVRRPIDPGDAPLITTGNLVIAGDPAVVQALAEAHRALLAQTGDVESPMHLWGTIRKAGGYSALQLEGWEASYSLDPMAGLLDSAGAPFQWSGVIQRRGAGALLLTDEYQPVLNAMTFELPNLPAELATGTVVYVQGGLVGETIEWSRIQVRPADETMVPPSAPVQAIVNQVELIYLAPQTSLISQTATPEELRVLMPVWSIRGQLDNGASFEIWVQAISPEYLR